MIGRYQENSDSELRETLAILQSHVSWADFVCVLLPVARFPSMALVLARFRSAIRCLQPSLPLPSRLFQPDRLTTSRAFFLRFFEIEHHLGGRVVLEDVTHVGGRLNADFLRRHYLDVIERLVRIEVALGRFLRRFRQQKRDTTSATGEFAGAPTEARKSSACCNFV